MTPEDLAKVRAMIDAAVAAAVDRAVDRAASKVVQPIRDEVDQLRVVDKRHDERLSSHSGAHRGIVESVRKSEETLRATTAEQILASQQLMSHALDAHRAETRAELRDLGARVHALSAVGEVAERARKSADSAYNAASALVPEQTQNRIALSGTRRVAVGGIVVTLVLGILQILANVYVAVSRPPPAPPANAATQWAPAPSSPMIAPR